jgi:stage III sporulation protein AE
LLGFVLLLTVTAQAAGGDNPETYALPEEYKMMLDGLPEALRDSLPEDVFTTDANTAARAWQTLASPEALLRHFLNALGADRQRYLSLIFTLCGVLLLRGIFGCTAASLRTPVLSGGMELLCRAVLFGVIAMQAMEQLASAVTFFDQLSELSSAFLPLMGAMYALGGNVSTAVVNHGTLVLSLTLAEWIGGKTVVPLFSLCLAFSLLGAFGPSVSSRMQVVTGKLKKWYTTLLSLTMLLLSAALGAQTTLSARTDSLTFRTVRFAVSSSLPVVGGGVAEMLKTAATGVRWLRGIVGVGGILLLLWLLLPQIISLLLTRAVYALASDVAHWLGCEGEAKFLSEIAALFGYLLAVVAVCVMTFLFALLLLLKCGAAYGG